MLQQLTQNTKSVAQDTVEWALAHGVGFKTGPFTTTHAPFTLTPTTISRDRFDTLKSKAGVLGKLIHGVSEDDKFIQGAIEPLVDGDPFFRHLYTKFKELQVDGLGSEKRLPLLIMRSDFMDDAIVGPKLIEFNSIAAGMGPFGEKVHDLHNYVQTQHSSTWKEYTTTTTATIAGSNGLVENTAINSLANGIASATLKIKNEFNDDGPPRFLMIVQPNEDNVLDQHLLEYALQKKGIQTIRKSFRELHNTLKTGEVKEDGGGSRLILDGIGTIDTVYLRSGYLHCDYYAADLDDKENCCQSLLKTRTFLEQHRVAMNATLRQQMASSKRVQTLLSEMEPLDLTKFGLSLEEAVTVKELLPRNFPVTEKTIDWIEANQIDLDDWVLKNQGEGGGHAIFGKDIITKLEQLSSKDYDAWCIMQRLKPAPRTAPTILVRKGEPEICLDLISEIGVFTVHTDGVPENENGYAGYLIRSKPSLTTEGGVHSGMGVLDSLMYTSEPAVN